MRFLTVILGLIAAAGLISAANAESVTGHASAEVSPALIITEGPELYFGKFTPPTSGTVQVGSDNGTLTGSSRITPGNDGRFQLVGTPNAAFTTAGTDTAVTLSGPGTSMNAALTFPGSGTLDGAGNGEVAVHGVLTVNANQTPGEYLGTYNVTVNYQ